MSILTLEHCSHSFGGRSIFEDVSFRLLKGEHVGLLGANGEGKSTFMKIITRKLEPEEGKITWSKNVKVGYLDQHAVLEPGMTIHDALAQAFAGLFDIEKQITAGYEKMADCTEDEMDELLEQIGEWQDTLEHHDFYQIDVKIEEVAQALGLSEIGLDRDVSELSGGQRTKILLAKLLLEKPDILLLDEPTNHLDMRSKDVLKEAIREFDGTVILVSHDRDFLDGLATKVYEFGGGLVKEHLGGIYEFLQKKKIDSLNELQKGAGLSASPTASAKGNEPETVQPSENKLSYEAQKELNKKIKKLERQVADCEASIEETESAIAIVEAKMATPEGASDMQLYERHQKLKQQLDGIVEEWERVSMELEEMKN